MSSLWCSPSSSTKRPQPSMAKLTVQGDATVIKKDREGIPG